MVNEWLKTGLVNHCLLILFKLHELDYDCICKSMFVYSVIKREIPEQGYPCN